MLIHVSKQGPRLPTSWQGDFARSFGKTSFRILRRGPELCRTKFICKHVTVNIVNTSWYLLMSWRDAICVSASADSRSVHERHHLKIWSPGPASHICTSGLKHLIRGYPFCLLHKWPIHLIPTKLLKKFQPVLHACVMTLVHCKLKCITASPCKPLPLGFRSQVLSRPVMRCIVPVLRLPLTTLMCTVP